MRVNRGANRHLIVMAFVTFRPSVYDAEGWGEVECYGNAKLNRFWFFWDSRG
jgi:hypothetical protein